MQKLHHDSLQITLAETFGSRGSCNEVEIYSGDCKSLIVLQMKKKQINCGQFGWL